jgi:D-aspartate ligase
VPALTLKVGQYVLHHGGLAVARSLGRAQVAVYVVCEDRWAPTACSRYVKGKFVWPTGGQDTYQEQLLGGIAAVGDRIGRPAVLIPTDDYAAIFVAEQADILRRWFLLPRMDPGLPRSLADKRLLYARCRELGVAVPETVVAETLEDIEHVIEAMSFPVVVKAAIPCLLPSGGRGPSTRIVDDRHQLHAIFASDATVRPYPALVQEHLPAGPAADWLFHAYCDASSTCLVAFTGQKVASFPPGTGETALGAAAANPVLEQQARGLLKDLRYSGVVSLDYRFDRRDGRFKLLDFNPRVGAIFRLFQTTSGIDVVRALHLDLTGRSVPPDPPVDGRTAVVEGYLLRECWSRLREGRGGPCGTLSSLVGAQERAWVARDDPVPAIVASMRVASRRVVAVTGRAPRSGPGHVPPRYVRGRASRRGR